jgi:UDP-glucose 4-epimerase
MSKILITGGAGYIGSHITRELVAAGEAVVVLDDLSAGHRAAVPDVPLVVGDFGRAALLAEILSGGEIDYVIHMAAFCEVGASMADPASYYDNNLKRSLTLLEAAREHGVKGVVFSSTAAVYGDPREIPITEDHPQAPTNPYGETKLALERALSWFHRAYGLSYVALRYFNAAGAHPDGGIGEDHAEETHLVPRLIRAAQHGGAPMPIFGDDYPTKDGTCVRDYVHVVDLAQAHLLALGALRRGSVGAESFNLGLGEGFTVREVLETVEAVVGARAPTRIAPRRPGDPAVLVAAPARAVRRLGWKPRYPALLDIIRTAWDWHRTHPEGYGDRPRPGSSG